MRARALSGWTNHPNLRQRLARLRQSTFNFNRELLLGEICALVMANVVAPTAAHFSRDARVISTGAVVGTLIGGGLGWLVARIHDQRRAKTYSARAIASDVAYFTPAAIAFGLGVYDPAIYLISHWFLVRGDGVIISVVVGQIVAFGLFAVGLNLYRFALLKLWGKSL
jgi:hypothetical protein